MTSERDPVLLLDMLPALSGHCVANRSPADIESNGDLGAAQTAFATQTSYLDHLLLIELGLADVGPTHGAALGVTISTVVVVRTKEHVGWVATSRIVAVMQNVQAVFYVSVGEHPSGPVRSFLAMRGSHPEVPVPIAVFGSDPRPALVGLPHNYLDQESQTSTFVKQHDAAPFSVVLGVGSGVHACAGPAILAAKEAA